MADLAFKDVLHLLILTHFVFFPLHLVKCFGSCLGLTNLPNVDNKLHNLHSRHARNNERGIARTQANVTGLELKLIPKGAPTCIRTNGWPVVYRSDRKLVSMCTGKHVYMT